MPNVNYNNGSLTIMLKNACPEAAHEGLLKGIIQSLKYQMQQDEPVDASLKQGNIYLLILLESILPDERQLEKAFK